MPHPGEELVSPTGSRLLLVRTGAETGGQLLEMEASYPGGGAWPPVHLHPSQAERFTVLEGELRVRVDGDERTYQAGEYFDVPAGTPHTMTADAPTRTRWEVRPALRTAEFFERMYSGAAADDFAAFLEEFAPEFRLAVDRVATEDESSRDPT